MEKSNLLWLGILIVSGIVFVYLLNTAYANPSELPDYAFTKPDIKKAYEFAKMNQNMLDGLPCNCGCMTLEGAEAHGSRVHSRGLIDCFMRGDINNGGKWEAHASECGMCYEDALYAKKLYSEGGTKEEIREKLEEKYAEQKFSDDTVYKNE